MSKGFGNALLNETSLSKIVNQKWVNEFVLDERRNDFVSLLSQLSNHARNIKILKWVWRVSGKPHQIDIAKFLLDYDPWCKVANLQRASIQFCRPHCSESSKVDCSCGLVEPPRPKPDEPKTTLPRTSRTAIDFSGNAARWTRTRTDARLNDNADLELII